jgi:hypothetical protein
MDTGGGMETVKRKAFLLGWLLLITPIALQAQFDYTVTTNQTVSCEIFRKPSV